ncbi:MAG: DNA-primase RepB domain-containing protein [Solirubrobacteraceae bacterium]
MWAVVAGWFVRGRVVSLGAARVARRGALPGWLGDGSRFLEVELLRRVVVTIRSLALRTEVYVGVVPRGRCGGGRADLVERASVVWADCDGSASVGALRGFRPMPGMVVGSGSARNCHVHWFLRELAALEVIERVNRRLARTLGADMRCSDAARILRPAGSVNRKHSPPTMVRLFRLAASERVAVEDLERCLAEEDEQPTRDIDRTGPRSARARVCIAK